MSHQNEIVNSKRSQVGHLIELQVLLNILNMNLTNKNIFIKIYALFLNVSVTKYKVNHFYIDYIWANNRVTQQSGLDISSWTLNSKRSQIGHLSQLQVHLNMSLISKNIIYKYLCITLECYRN